MSRIAEQYLSNPSRKQLCDAISTLIQQTNSKLVRGHVELFDPWLAMESIGNQGFLRYTGTGTSSAAKVAQIEVGWQWSGPRNLHVYLAGHKRNYAGRRYHATVDFPDLIGLEDRYNRLVTALELRWTRYCEKITVLVPPPSGGFECPALVGVGPNGELLTTEFNHGQHGGVDYEIYLPIGYGYYVAVRHAYTEEGYIGQPQRHVTYIVEHQAHRTRRLLHTVAQVIDIAALQRQIPIHVPSKSNTVLRGFDV